MGNPRVNFTGSKDVFSRICEIMMNSPWLGGLQKTPIVIGVNLGKRMSKTRFSISLQCRIVVLK